MNQKKKDLKQEFTLVGEESPSIEISQAPQSIDVPISFDAWWLQTQGKYKFKPELKEAVRRHFEARGFTDYKNYNAGLRDFGFRT
jgi:hypothetical protein